MKTCNVVQFWVIVMLASSCASKKIEFANARIQHIYETPKGLNFKNGKWLINRIETDIPLKANEALTQRMLKKLKGLGSDSITYIGDVELNYLDINQIKFDIPPHVIEMLKQTTDFDYVMNIRADEIADGLGSVIDSPPPYYTKNQSEVHITVYDVGSGLKIYSQHVIATIAMDENNSRDAITIGKSSRELVFKALKKGFKDIKKYAARNK